LLTDLQQEHEGTRKENKIVENSPMNHAKIKKRFMISSFLFMGETKLERPLSDPSLSLLPRCATLLGNIMGV
jgi:hypothetical protein